MGMLTVPSPILQALSSLSSLIIRKWNTLTTASYPLQKGHHRAQFNVMFSACKVNQYQNRPFEQYFCFLRTLSIMLFSTTYIRNHMISFSQNLVPEKNLFL